jgi:hypothetical protein
MKVAIFILITVSPFFISGGLSARFPCMLCSDLKDTSILPADTALQILSHAMDTAFTPVLERIDSSYRVLDSLNVLLDSLKREHGKRKVLGRVDIWQPSHLNYDTLKWWYWRFPDGELKFINTTKH